MHYRVHFAAFAAVLALAACDSKPTPPVGADDPTSPNYVENKTAKVELPPMPKSSKSYRCDDQSVINVQLFQGDLQASVAEDKGMPTMLKAPEAGKPFVAEGYSLTVKGSDISVTRPGHGTQSCTG